MNGGGLLAGIRVLVPATPCHALDTLLARIGFSDAEVEALRSDGTLPA